MLGVMPPSRVRVLEGSTRKARLRRRRTGAISEPAEVLQMHKQGALSGRIQPQAPRAREVRQLRLRAHLKSLGISPRSATEPIDDTSTGKLMDGVLAAFARSTATGAQNGPAPECVALELGCWTFPAALGYLNAPEWSGRSLIPYTERGPLVKRAFEELATERFTKREVIARATDAGLRRPRGLTPAARSFGQIMQNPTCMKVKSLDSGRCGVPRNSVQSNVATAPLSALGASGKADEGRSTSSEPNPVRATGLALRVEPWN